MENRIYLTSYIFLNAITIVYFITALKRPKTGRLLFFILFGYSSGMTWNIALTNAGEYLNERDITLLMVYKSLLPVWFSQHTQTIIGLIATVEGLIAVSLLTKGKLYKTAVLAGVTILAGIAIVGLGAGFPFIILAISLGLLKGENQNIWHLHSGKFILNTE